MLRQASTRFCHKICVTYTEHTFFEALEKAGMCRNVGKTTRLENFEQCMGHARTAGVSRRTSVSGCKDRQTSHNTLRNDRRRQMSTNTESRSDRMHAENTSAGIQSQEDEKRLRTVQGLPVMLSRQELADCLDPMRSLEAPTLKPAEPTELPGSRSKLRLSRLRDFIGTLPIRNYVHDFSMWDMSTAEIWQRYQMLPEPRCSSISRTALRYVLMSLAKEHPRTRKGMLRFLSIIDEMRAQNPPIVPDVAEWTAAISFCGRHHKRPQSTDLDQCMALWDEMENVYGVKANRVTFNVLIDIAVKTRRWQTTAALLAELKNRRISPDRYTWSTLIQKAGLREDGDDVRRLARLMVESGEVVDVYIINSVMTSLIRAGEGDAAEHLFERIKRLTLETQASIGSADMQGPKDHRTLSSLTSGYQFRARMNRRSLRQGRSLTEADISPKTEEAEPYFLTPDIASFNLLLQYHCTTTGNFARVSALLEDMEKFKIPDSIAMFHSLFLGFATHGTKPGHGDWTLARLQYIFKTLMGSSEVRITQDVARVAIRAFGVLGSKGLVQARWEQLDKHWQKQGGTPSRRSSNVLSELEAALQRQQEL